MKTRQSLLRLFDQKCYCTSGTGSHKCAKTTKAMSISSCLLKIYWYRFINLMCHKFWFIWQSQKEFNTMTEKQLDRSLNKLRFWFKQTWEWLYGEFKKQYLTDNGIISTTGTTPQNAPIFQKDWHLFLRSLRARLFHMFKCI